MLIKGGMGEGGRGARGGDVKISLCYSRGFLSFITREVSEFSVCGVFVDD